MNLIWRLLKDEEGQDLVEYALLVAAIALFLVAGVQQFAQGLSTVFGSISTALGSI